MEVFEDVNADIVITHPEVEHYSTLVNWPLGFGTWLCLIRIFLVISSNNVVTVVSKSSRMVS